MPSDGDVTQGIANAYNLWRSVCHRQGSASFWGAIAMKLLEIIHVIEKTAPPKEAASWDNCGVQVAPAAPLADKDITRLSLCLDPTPAALQQAVHTGAQCLLSHHPLLLQPRLPAVADAFHQVLSLCFRHDMALYSAHTSLDINPQGPAGWLARELCLQNTALLEVTGELDGQPCGFGLAGDLPEALILPDLLAKLGRHIDLATAVACGPQPAHIRRVAYCTGSGSSLAQYALAQGAHIFITGDIKYHSALEAPLCMLDVGHHSLEEEMMRRFAVQLAAELTGVKVDFIPSSSPLRPAALAAATC